MGSGFTGGAADKAGLAHEALWGVYAMVRVLDGKASDIRVEPPRMDGADFYVTTEGGREYWQAKRQLLSQQTWTLAALEREGILQFFLERLRGGDRCVFVSITDAPELRVLAESALHAQDYAEFESTFLTVERRTHMRQLCQYWGGIGAAEAFECLRRTRVEGAQEPTLERFLLCFLGVTFECPAETVLDCLELLYLHSAHKTLDADAIRAHLATRGMRPRAATLPSTAPQTIANVTKTYLAGQRARLICGQQISRQAAIDIAERIVASAVPLDTILIAPAGGGKSACLFEIVTILAQSHVPVFAFGLDRVKPVLNTVSLGAQFGLSESPPVVLARSYPKQKCVVIIDQLDVVSSMSGRHPDFFDTVAALVEEVRGLRSSSSVHLVLACRRFDFEHDHRLRSFLPKGQHPIDLALLSGQEVKTVLSGAGGDVSFLSARQSELLRLPQNLSLFVASGLARLREPPFTTQTDLFDAYWKAKHEEIAASRPEEVVHWPRLIQRLTDEMSEREELSVPSSQLDDFPPRFVAALISSGFLSADERRVGFGHESLFDYCFARVAARGREEFVATLEGDEQHLFRRAQLRQALVFLRDYDLPRYLRNVDLALSSPKIRPHLKVLVLELLGALPAPCEEELALLMPLVAAELVCQRDGTTSTNKLARRAFDVFFRSPTLFRIADKLGYVSRWLNSGEPRIEDLSVMYLHFQIEHNADRVAELVEPFVGRSEPWKRRLRTLMTWPRFTRGRRFFELLLRLLDDGTLDGDENEPGIRSPWDVLHSLSDSRPEWSAELAAHWIEREAVRMAREYNGRGRSFSEDQSGIEHVYSSARNAAGPFLSRVLPAVIRAAAVTRCTEEDGFPRDEIWPLYISGGVPSLSDAYLGACNEAFATLAKAGVDDLRPFIAILREAGTYTANFLLLNAYLTAPRLWAEEAMSLLAAEPARLLCGFEDSALWTSRCLIEKCSPYCSQSTFDKLEATILGFSTPFERSKDGFRSRGHASFDLLGSLCSARRSQAAAARFDELQRKFVRVQGPPQGVRSYSVVSPIPKASAEHMTDQQWLAAIAKYNKPRVGPDWQHPERGGAWELAALLRELALRDPERFARLALRFPAGTDSSYFMNVLYALKELSLTPDLPIEVVRRVAALEDTACTKAALEVVASLHRYPLPEDTYAFVIKAATEHPDPLGRQMPSTGEARTRDLVTEGLNSVRGRAAGAIRDLILTDGRHLEVFREALEQMTNDKAISVRFCVASTLTAVARFDPRMAINLFSRLADAEDWLLGTPEVERFISLGLEGYFKDLCGYVERMLRSSVPEVTRAGGRLACLARLYHADADGLAEGAIGGCSASRLGAAEIAEANLPHPQCKTWCEQALTRLFDDQDLQVRQAAAQCFRRLWKHPALQLSGFAPLIAAFLRSKAFVDSPTMLLHALEKTTQQLPDITLDTCEQFVERCAAQARDIRTAHAADENIIGTLVFRCYAQFQSPAMRARALALVDRMCEEGLQSASKGLLEFER